MAQPKPQTPPRDLETVETDLSASPLTLRRSGRARKRPAEYDDDADYQNGTSANNINNNSSSSNTNNANADASTSTRRNTKRRATPEAFNVPENLLEASLGPWQEGEPAEWNSWIELESDPAFFTEIMKRIGVKGAKIEEVLSVDEFNLATLPEPVHGLVFLYEYVSEDSEEEDDGGEQGVWFANQTTHNACATIALLNIIMNAEGISLDERLRKFKEATQELSPPLRGNMINNSEWIQVAHNSFARRLDLLDAALSLQNEVDRRKKRPRAVGQNKKARAKKGSAKPKVRSSDGPSAYHFIAFVPVGNQVWQLDGLSSSAPICIGEFTKDKHWTSVMCPVLQDRMMRYETEQLSFSLLALCGDGLGQVRRRLAANIRGLVDLEGRFGSGSGSGSGSTREANGADVGEEEGGDKIKGKGGEEKEEDQEQDWWRARTDRTDAIHTTDDAHLSGFQLDVDDILAVEVGNGVGGETASPSSSSPSPTSSSPPFPDDANAAIELWDRLCAEQKKLRAEYEAEEVMGGLGAEALLGRTKDYTPAVHEWVRRLAEKGALRELYETVAVGGM